MRRRIGILVAGLVLLAPDTARAGQMEVTINDNFFSPTSVSTSVGGAVHWSRDPAALGFHNVVQRRGLFDSGAATNDPAFSFTRRFSAGRFPYICEVHFVSDKMTGSVRVPPGFSTRPEGLPFTVRWANADTNTGRVFDVRFRVDDGNWRIWKTDTSRFRAVFGKDGKPVRVRSGHEYEFQARSQRRANTPRRVSGWSPVLTVMI